MIFYYEVEVESWSQQFVHFFTHDYLCTSSLMTNLNGIYVVVRTETS